MEKICSLKTLFFLLFISASFSNETSDFPELNEDTFISIICNGEMNLDSPLKDKIKNSAAIIGVDGGINFCFAMQLTPNWIVGDFDSVDPDILQQIMLNSDQPKLSRAKDFTDLEVGVEKAINDYPKKKIVIFGGLGGRIDHTLGNIHLLLRYPGIVFLETEDQLLFAIDERAGKIQLSHEMGKTFALFPMLGPVDNVVFQDKHFPILDKSNFCIGSLSDNDNLQVGKGVVLVIIDKRSISPLPHLPQAPIKIENSLSTSVIHLLSYLFHQSNHGEKVILYTEGEEIFYLQSSQSNNIFPTCLGETISLIPFYGKAQDIKTKGLKWELGEYINSLENGTQGISNVSMNTKNVSINVNQGALLCIFNHNIIDTEMVEIPLNTNQ